MSLDVSFRLRQNLGTLLKERGLTASQLSRKTGVAKQVLSDWMSGVQPRKLEQLYVVAKTLGVSMDELCFGDPGKSVPSSTVDQRVGTVVLPSGGAGPQEIKGRFEVYLRRISDE